MANPCGAAVGACVWPNAAPGQITCVDYAGSGANTQSCNSPNVWHAGKSCKDVATVQTTGVCTNAPTLASYLCVTEWYAPGSCFSCMICSGTCSRAP
jgi:hypothetical protein